jgi:hypothetical protein
MRGTELKLKNRINVRELVDGELIPPGIRSIDLLGDAQ